MSYEFNLLYYARIFKKRGIAIIVVVALSVFLAIFLSSLQAPLYVSNASLLFEEGGAASSASSVGRLLGIPVIGAGGSSKELVVTILKSRRMTDDIKAQFRDEEKAGDTWRIETEPLSNILIIKVKSTDPDLAKNVLKRKKGNVVLRPPKLLFYLIINSYPILDEPINSFIVSLGGSNSLTDR